MSFKYLFIPANPQSPIVEHEASKSGGLENDFLRKHAEETFTSGNMDREAQRAAVAEQLASKGIDGSKIDEILSSHMGDRIAGSVEIITLYIPKSSNGFVSISLYCDGNSAFKEGGKVPNVRATSLARACGHVNVMVMGDCFIGKAKDDEREEWKRLDFLLEEFSIGARWVMLASVENEGKNLATHSTSGALEMMQGSMAKEPPKPAPPMASEFSAGQTYIWSQNEDEVEIRMKLPKGLLSKHITVLITPTGLFISRKAGGGVEGLDPVFSASSSGAKLGGTVKADDSTWSIADEHEGRLLTLTLSKAKNGNWKQLLV